MGVTKKPSNMRALVITFFLAAWANAHPDYSDSWEEFKDKYGKAYEDDDEEVYRKSVWSKNVDFISSHNEEYTNGVHDFAVGENEFADMTTDEITSYFNGLDTEEISQSGEKFHSDVSVKSLPSEIDWRKNGSVTPVKKQPLLPKQASWSLLVNKTWWIVLKKRATMDVLE